MFNNGTGWAETVVIAPTATLKEAADKMTETNTSVLSVGTRRGIEGTITDRDIVTGAVSRGKDPARERVRDHMSRHVFIYG